MMTKAEMIAMANAWMADYENGVADMRPLEAMAEILLQSAKLAGYNTKEADRKRRWKQLKGLSWSFYITIGRPALFIYLRILYVGDK